MLAGLWLHFPLTSLLSSVLAPRPPAFLLQPQQLRGLPAWTQDHGDLPVQGGLASCRWGSWSPRVSSKPLLWVTAWTSRGHHPEHPPHPCPLPCGRCSCPGLQEFGCFAEGLCERSEAGHGPSCSGSPPGLGVAHCWQNLRKEEVVGTEDGQPGLGLPLTVPGQQG